MDIIKLQRNKILSHLSGVPVQIGLLSTAEIILKCAVQKGPYDWKIRFVESLEKEEYYNSSVCK